MKKPVISDLARTVAAECWRTWPNMKPVGKERQEKDLEQLDSLLSSGVTQSELCSIIELLSGNRYCRTWVSTFTAIAQELPKIRMVLKPIETISNAVSPASLIQQFRQNRD